MRRCRAAAAADSIIFPDLETVQLNPYAEIIDVLIPRRMNMEETPSDEIFSPLHKHLYGNLTGDGRSPDTGATATPTRTGDNYTPMGGQSYSESGTPLSVPLGSCL